MPSPPSLPRRNAKRKHNNDDDNAAKDGDDQHYLVMPPAKKRARRSPPSPAAAGTPGARNKTTTTTGNQEKTKKKVEETPRPLSCKSSGSVVTPVTIPVPPRTKHNGNGLAAALKQDDDEKEPQIQPPSPPSPLPLLLMSQESSKTKSLSFSRWLWLLLLGSSMTLASVASWSLARATPPNATLLDVAFSGLLWILSSGGRQDAAASAAAVHYCFLDSAKEGASAPATSASSASAQCHAAVVSSGSVQWVPCPAGAVCQGGTLLSCPPLHVLAELPAASKSPCHLSTPTNRTIEALYDLLHEWTVRAYCHDHEDTQEQQHVQYVSWMERPLFPYRQVVQALDCCTNDLRFLYLGNQTTTGSKFVLEASESSGDSTDVVVWVGLHPQAPLRLPTSCLLGRASLSLVFFAATTATWLSTAVGHAALRLYISATDDRNHLDAPVVVATASVLLLMLFCFLRHYCRQRAQRQHKTNVQQACRIVFQYLQQVSCETSVPTPWLAQHVFTTLHNNNNSSSNKERHHFLTSTWPAVQKVLRPRLHATYYAQVEYWTLRPRREDDQ